MFAPGAIVWAYSTSSDVSTPQPNAAGSFWLTGPSGVMMSNEGGAGRPYSWSKLCRSCWIVGDPNASTMTIVFPAPVSPARYSGVMSYAWWSCGGP